MYIFKKKKKVYISLSFEQYWKRKKKRKKERGRLNSITLSYYKPLDIYELCSLPFHNTHWKRLPTTTIYKPTTTLLSS